MPALAPFQGAAHQQFLLRRLWWFAWLAQLDLTEIHWWSAVLELLILLPQPGISKLYDKHGDRGRVKPFPAGFERSLLVSHSAGNFLVPYVMGQQSLPHQRRWYSSLDDAAPADSGM